MTNIQYIQICRSIDKFDKIGRDGVVFLLQKPIEEFGANISPVHAELIGRFLDIKCISDLNAYFKYAQHIRTRLDLMVLLEKTIESDNITKWDQLLAMPSNEDQTWSNGGRPANIAWALDDMIAVIRRKEPMS